MFQLTSLVQKAQSLIDPAVAALNPSERGPSKTSLFRQQFRLPDSQNPLAEISAELTLPLPYTSSSAPAISGEKQRDGAGGTRYAGELHLSENFICFSTQRTSFLPNASISSANAFQGQTHGAGPAGNGFTMPLSAIRRVERLNSQQHVFSLALTTWTGFMSRSQGKEGTVTPQKFIVQLVGSRQAAERFCDALKKGLRQASKEVDSLRTAIGSCYSEYVLENRGPNARENQEKDAAPREPPDAGLGMVFRYPGDARKLRDKSKMRLWGEYMRGQYIDCLTGLDCAKMT